VCLLFLFFLRESKRPAEQREVKKCPADTFLGRGRFPPIEDTFRRKVDTIGKQLREQKDSAKECLLFLFFLRESKRPAEQREVKKCSMEIPFVAKQLIIQSKKESFVKMQHFSRGIVGSKTLENGYRRITNAPSRSGERAFAITVFLTAYLRPHL